MPKNKGRNAFYFFMIDWKKREEARGCTFPNDLKDVQASQKCNEEWQSLTKQQKGLYEARAKKNKIQSERNTNSKKTTFGEPIKFLEEEEKAKREFRLDMHEYLESTIIRAVNHNVLPQLKFCFIHVNWFFTKIVDNITEYFPAEYAIGVFSLENGIEDIHHTIVNAPIPLGYKRQALETSRSNHNIPIENQNGESNFAVMYEKFTNFLKHRKIVDRYPPLYTIKGLTGAVQSLITKLCDAAGQDKEQFLIYEIESLFKHLADEAYKKRADRDIQHTAAYAEYTFTRLDSKYLYKRGNECLIHEFMEGGSEYCSKLVLYRWAWGMCEEFCEPLQIDMKPGVHFPDDTDCTYKLITQSMANLDIKLEIPQISDQCSVVSATGVREQHRIKVSERTYEEKMVLRSKCQPVTVVDHSKLNEPIIDGSGHKKFDERPMRAPNTISYVAATMDDYAPKNDETNFPPIGGRGVLHRKIKEVSRKASLGRGQGYA
ncbi:PREDICTED: protein maelstrom homolog [Dinoponera quadriceps]|uniref:Protein maelstrom homolog n=1 Tax=Dinoponera quadriceps TaxID=609295 RepID=A0A6P3YE43_DINQU|nr:PREDICTED: protein maelstrom homolog [Dinoponera quadriceps]XP_014488169.1 PREDICTED: protein maelstrom homolog [Dinoponera quadriceps]